MASDRIQANTRNPKLSSDDFSPDMQSSLMDNWVRAYEGMTREKAAVEIMRLFLANNGHNDGPKTARDLFPAAWKLRSTVIPIDFASRRAPLRDAIAEIRAYDRMGKEIRWLGADKDMSPVDRIWAEWPATVDMASAVLSATDNKVVTRDEVLRLNEQSPEAYRLLKEAVALFKAHFNRLLDPVAGRRDPKFQDVAARYKAQIRSLAAEQQELSMRQGELSRRMEQLLAERDAELSTLDPGYNSKHVSAAAVGLDKRLMFNV
ncbi:hypothetical protein V1515DRAFT_592963 [Lipomyces mesembrius]